MTARVLDGKQFAAELQHELAQQAAIVHRYLGFVPQLAIVLVADEGTKNASDVYVRQLRRSARLCGIESRLVQLPTTVTPIELVATIAELNHDAQVHGIIVQLPLPPHLDREVLLTAIDPEKDVDGIGDLNAGRLFLNLPAYVPATCAAIMEMLTRAAIPLDGRRVVIVGASSVVGKPLALILLRYHATVSVCHIYTEDLAAFTREAEVLVVAAGKAGLITAAMVRPSATVIDVGINVLADGKVIGDVDFTAVATVAGAITPVPGGIGPLTNLMVIRQTLTPLTDVLLQR